MANKEERQKLKEELIILTKELVKEKSIKDRIAELKVLMNEDYLNNLSEQDKKDLYNELIQLYYPLYASSSELRRDNFRRAEVNRKLWNVYATQKGQTDKEK